MGLPRLHVPVFGASIRVLMVSSSSVTVAGFRHGCCRFRAATLSAGLLVPTTGTASLFWWILGSVGAQLASGHAGSGI
jgi:hypothetical protein